MREHWEGLILSMGTTTKRSFENFQRQHPFKENYVKYLEKETVYIASL